jgi:4'-phosphopantetheinyl transferase
LKTIIHLLYHVISPDRAISSLAELCAQLPDNVLDKAKRYQSNIAALQHIIGRRLLQDGLQKSFARDTLDSLFYSDQGKPMLPHTQFNISHSANVIICAFSTEGAIGIDIELPQSTDPQHLKHSFTSVEWQIIEQNPTMLYQLWCRKEAVIKATHYKLQDLHKIDVSYLDDHFTMDGKSWHLRSLDFLPGLGAHAAICTEAELKEINIEECFY